MPYKILKKQELVPTIFLMVIDSPHIARKAEPGQFVMLRINGKGERIPLTIADYDRKEGTITMIFQTVIKVMVRGIGITPAHKLRWL